MFKCDQVRAQVRAQGRIGVTPGGAVLQSLTVVFVQTVSGTGRRGAQETCGSPGSSTDKSGSLR